MKNLVPVAKKAVSPAAVASKRKYVALAVAAASDAVQLAFLPLFSEGAGSPFELVLDGATALAILLVLGFRWRLLVALALELVPGVDLAPTWTAVVLTLPTLPREPPPAALPPPAGGAPPPGDQPPKMTSASATSAGSACT